MDGHGPAGGWQRGSGAASWPRWLAGTLRQAGWAPAGVFALHAVAWRLLDAYARFPALDVPMHLLGGAAIAYFCHAASLQGSRDGLLGPYHPVTHAALVFGLTCAAAVFWEFAEFLTDRYLGTNAQGGDLDDTLLDLLLGIVGGVTFLAASAALRRQTRDGSPGTPGPPPRA